MLKKLSAYNLIFIVIMALFLIWGLLVFRDYGLSWDEEIQRSRGLAGLRTILVITQGEDSLPERLNEQDVRSRGYGTLGIKLPVVLIEYASGFGMSNEKVFRIYHLYNFLVFFVSVFFLYLMLNRLGFDREYGLLGVLLYILCPRILADSFYNNKDLMFLSLYTICLSLSVFLVMDFTWKNAVLLGVMTALLLSVRSAGAFPIVVFAFYYFVKALLSRDKKVIIRDLIRLSVTVAVCVAFLALITPKMWVDFSGSVMTKMTKSFTFSHGGFDLVMGQLLNRMDLPWYYLPLTIAMTTPCIYLIFSTAGFIVSAIRALSRTEGIRIKGEIREEGIILALLWLQLAVVLAYNIVMRPMQYNMWRHFYFIFVYLVIFTVYGLREAIVRSASGIRLVLRLFAVVSLLLSLVWIAVNHPYEYLYFNPIFSGRAAEETVQDYWAVSYRGLLSQIKDGSTADVYIRPTLTGNQFFGQAGWENFHLEALRESAKYRIEEGNPGDDAFYKILKTVEVDGRICESLVRREEYGNVLRRYFIEDGMVSGKNYGPEVEFSIYSEGVDSCILMKLPEELKVSELDILYGDLFRMSREDEDSAEDEDGSLETESFEDASGVFGNARVYVSDNGEDYRALSPEELMEGRTMLGAKSRKDFLPPYIMFRYENRLPAGSPEFALRFFGEQTGAMQDKADVYYNRYEAKEKIRAIRAGDGSAEVEVRALTDGREDTAAVFSDRMRGTEYIEFETDESILPLRGLHLDCGVYPPGTGRDIVIEGSQDGVSYTELPWYYASADDHLFEEESSFRYYRVSQKGNSGHPWHVSELGLIVNVNK